MDCLTNESKITGSVFGTKYILKSSHATNKNKSQINNR